MYKREIDEFLRQMDRNRINPDHLEEESPFPPSQHIDNVIKQGEHPNRIGSDNADKRTAPQLLLIRNTKLHNTPTNGNSTPANTKPATFRLSVNPSLRNLINSPVNIPNIAVTIPGNVDNNPSGSKILDANAPATTNDPHSRPVAFQREWSRPPHPAQG